MFRLKSLLSLEPLGKCLLTRARNLQPMLVATFRLKGGLNHVMFRRRFLRFFFSWSPFRSLRNSVLSPKPLSARALSYMVLASSNTASLLEMSVSRRLIEAGKLKFLMMFGGWLDWQWTYTGRSLGFRYG